MKFKLFLVVLLFPAAVFAASGLSVPEKFREAYCFYETEEYQEAVAGFREIKGKFPILEEYLEYYLADSLNHTDQLSRSAAAWKTFLKKYPKSLLLVPARIRYAENLFNTGRFQEAVIQYKKLLLKKRSIPKKEVPVVYKNLATCYEKTGDKVKALEHYRRLYFDFPLAEETLDTEEKRLELSRQVSLPFQEKDFYGRIRILSSTFANKERDQAIEDYKRRFPKGEYRPQVWYEISNIAYRDNKIKKVKKMLSDIKVTFPSHSYAQKASYRLSKVYWNKNEGNNAIKEIDVFLKKFPASKWSDDALFLSARIRDSLGQKKAAVKLYKEVGDKYPKSKHVGKALWRGAWISFGNRDFLKAAELFDLCSGKANHFFIRDSARYWLGRSREALEQLDPAAAAYKKLVDKQIKNYYSFQARERLEEIRKRLKWPPKSVTKPVKKICKHREFDKKMKLADTLIDLLMLEQAAEVLKRLSWAACNDPAHNIAMAESLKSAGDYRRAIRVAYAFGESELEYQNIFPLNFRYQVFKQAQIEGIDPYLVMGLIRQESVFQEEALSVSGAIGLMQIIPPTGRRLARQLNIKNFQKKELYDPDLNIRLGTYYLAQHLKEFGNNPILAAAAYNAGENKVRRWLKKGPVKDMTVFVENIPYPQTRTYVKKVFSHYYNYRLLYQGSPGDNLP